MTESNPAVRRSARVLLGALLLASAAALPAAGHVHTDPATVSPGARATVAFRITHGCDGAPTVRVAVKVPAGVTGVTPVAVAGWKTSVRDRVVTWSGGRLPADVTQRFSITATFPKIKGVLAFPMVQTCTKGQNAWIQLPVPGGPEPARPAPQVGVGTAVHDH